MLYSYHPLERTVIATKRNAIQDLINWKNDEERKPLVLKGAYVKIGLNQEKPYKTRV